MLYHRGYRVSNISSLYTSNGLALKWNARISHIIKDMRVYRGESQHASKRSGRPLYRTGWNKGEILNRQGDITGSEGRVI